MKNILCTLIIFLHFFKSETQAQEVVFQDNVRVLYSINYNNPHQTDFNAQRIIKLISDANNIPLYSVSVDVRYDEITKILQTGTQLKLSAEIRNPEFSGDCFYKDFPLTHMLMPDEINFTVNLISFPSKSLVWQKKYTEDFKNGQTQLFNFNYTDTTRSRFKMDISDISLVYSFQTYTRISEYTDLINAYYKDAKILENINRQMGMVNLNQLDQLRIQQQNLRNMRADIRAIDSKDYYRKLDLHQNDPLRFSSYFRETENKLNAAENDVEQQIRMLPGIYFEQGFKLAQAGNSDGALHWYNMSLRENPDFAPAIIETARIFYQKNKLTEAMEKVLYVKERLRTDPAATTNNEQLAEDIIDALLNIATKSTKQRSYNEALKQITAINTFCERMQLYNCAEKTANATSDAAVGLFGQMLDNIINMLNGNQLANAEKQIGEANALGQQYALFLNYEPAIAEQYNNLYNAYTQSANSSSYNARWEEALLQVKNARRICQTYKSVNCTPELDQIELEARNGIYKDLLNTSDKQLYAGRIDESSNYLQKASDYRYTWRLSELPLENALEKRINQAKYTDYIARGKNLISSNPTEALVFFSKASDIAYSSDVMVDKNLSNYIQSAATNKFNYTIQRGYELVNQNNLNQARSVFAEARQIAVSYNMSTNTDVTAKLDDLRAKIFSKECQNRYAQYEKLAQEGEMLIKKLTFIEAERKLAEAISFSNQYNECQINTSNVVARLDEIFPAARFEEYLIEVNSLIMSKSFTRAIEIYAQLESYHTEFNLRSLNINYLPLENFALTKNNDFIYYLAQKYVGEKNPLKGLYYLDELRKRKYSASETRQIQEAAARQLALSDYQKDAQADSKLLVLQYTMKDKWYKRFSKAYLKEWKRLRK